MQTALHIHPYDQAHCTQTNEYILRDRGLSCSGRGLLIQILFLPKHSQLSFQDLYNEAKSTKNKEELIDAFINLKQVGYVHENIEIDEKRGLNLAARYMPITYVLTQQAKRLRGF